MQLDLQLLHHALASTREKARGIIQPEIHFLLLLLLLLLLMPTLRPDFTLCWFNDVDDNIAFEKPRLHKDTQPLCGTYHATNPVILVTAIMCGSRWVDSDIISAI